MNVVEKIEKEFITISDKYYKKTGYDYWNNHVKYVVDAALRLAGENGADKEIVEIAAILHDVAKPLEIRKNKSHNIAGAEIAGKILKKYNIEDDKINRIKKCIVYHSGDINVELTKEEWCVRNADIISLFDNITVFYHIVFVEENMNYEDGRKMILSMVKSKYNKLDEKLKTIYKDEYRTLYNSI